MEIVSIEKKAFETMVAKFDRFVCRMESICERNSDKTMNKWMDNRNQGVFILFPPLAWLVSSA